MELVQETNCRAMLDELSTLSDYIRAMRTHYKPQMNGERYYTTEEMCQVLKITKRTLQQYRDDGIIPFVGLSLHCEGSIAITTRVWFAKCVILRPLHCEGSIAISTPCGMRSVIVSLRV